MAARLLFFQSLLLLIAVSSNDALKYVCPDVISAPKYYKKVHFEPQLVEHSGQTGQSGYKGKHYAKIRFRIFYDESMDKMPPELKSLTQDVVDFWSVVLSVRPYNDKIFMERQCPTPINLLMYSKESKKYEERCIGQCLDRTMCLNTVVPEDHLKECSYCSEDGTKCQTTGERGRGIQNADMVFYVSALQTENCHESIIAYATPCSQEPYMDRAVTGGVNLCPHIVLPVLKTNKDLIVSTLKHEMMHALGFASSLYNYYRDSDGEPLVKRDEYGRPTLMWYNQEFGPKIVRTIERKWHVRGPIVSSNRTFIVTPNVVREVRAHFNCSELEGAELEDRKGNMTAAAHWATRIYYDDTMLGSNDGADRMSRIDFALLEDTGWYKVNYSLAEPVEYRKDLGCDFCMKSCKYFMDKKRSEGQSIEPFCDQTAEQSSSLSCNSTLKIYSGCPLFRNEDPVPKEHQYFDKLEGVDDDDLHFYSGIDKMADFCPIPLTRYKMSCSEKLTAENPLSKILNPATVFPFETFSNDSYCFESRTNWTIKEYKDTCNQVKTLGRGQNAGCYKYSCLSGLLVLKVSNKLFPCFFEGQVLEVSLFRSTGYSTNEGTIVCPSCQQICGQSSYFKCMSENPKLASEYPYDKHECIDADYLKKMIKSLNEEGKTKANEANVLKQY